MKSEKSKKLLIPHRNVIHVVDESEILFCQSENCYTTVFLSDGRSFVLIKSLTKLEKEVHQSVFIKVSQSFLVNRNKIVNIDKKNRYLHVGLESPIPFTITVKRLLELITGDSMIHSPEVS